MKKIYFLIKLLPVLLILLHTTVVAQESLQIQSDKDTIKLDPKEEYVPEAIYTNGDGETEEVSIKWHTEPGFLGKVNQEGVLIANHPGEGWLFAKYQELRDSIPLVVKGAMKDGDDDDDEDEDEDEDEEDYPKVKIIPGKIKIDVLDSMELVAFYINEEGVKVDTTFTWSVEPEGIGEFKDPASSLFHAGETPAEGIIVAQLGVLADTVKLSIREPKEKKQKQNNARKVVITPGDTIVPAIAGTTIQYAAEVKSNGNKHSNGEAEWELKGADIGEISEDGLLELNGETGMALVQAKIGNFKGWVEILVVDENTDPVVNTITIHRVLPDGHILPPKTFNEGESYKIGGLPFPLNILNGGMLHFPFGCISEDILIYMFIPEEYAEVDDESQEVTFDSEVITGVKFSVIPESSDTIVSPFDFNVPVTLCMTFKKGLLDSLGVSPENLDVFFADNTGFDTTAVGDVAVDTVKNKIYASIHHFSTIVVRGNQSGTLIQDFENSPGVSLTAYPNPFQTSVNILFKLEESAEVDISVYNIVGQRVKTIEKRQFPEGMHTLSWDGSNNFGDGSPRGIYLIRMMKNKAPAKTIRVILNR